MPNARILFVDDDAAILAALRTRLHAKRVGWAMRFVESGAHAIAALEQEPFDLIVSDLRMPGMDGTELLHIVRERWPQAVRIVLSSDPNIEHVLRVASVAHQFLRKPCHSPHFENALERCLAVQSLLNSPELRAIVGRIEKLPAVPTIFASLQRAMADSKTSPREVAQIVATDTAVTARTLQMANSAFFRRGRRITNIEQAVMQLGFDGVRNLVLCAEVFAKWPAKFPDAPLDLDLLQQYTMTVGRVAGALTHGTALADDTMLAALLHEIGYWVMLQECPDALDRALRSAIDEGSPMHEAERRIIGASHAEIGAYLLGVWGLPFTVVEAVANHHTPERVKHTEFDVLAALVMARELAGTDETHAFRGVPPADRLCGERYFESIGLPFTWAEAEARAAECSRSDRQA